MSSSGVRGLEKTPFIREPTYFDSYVAKVRQVYVVLQRVNQLLADAMASFLIEPINAFKAGWWYMVGKAPINPVLPGRRDRAIVFLFHGDHSSSSIFGPLVDALVRANPHRHIVTIDMTSKDGIVSKEKHLSQVSDLVERSLGLYRGGVRPPYICVGHSSGGDLLPFLIEEMLRRNAPLPDTCIQIGSVMRRDQVVAGAKKLLILGQYDVIVPAQESAVEQVLIPSGHVGLPFHPEAISRVNEAIQTLDRASHSLAQSA